MMNHDDAFLPETIEEQIDQARFAPSHQPLSPETRLILELQAHYAEDRRSAARMWERLAQRASELESTGQPPTGVPQGQQKGTVRMSPFVNTPPLSHPQSAPGANRQRARQIWQRRLGLLVAALVTLLLIGSLAAVLEFAHQKPSPATASPNATASAPTFGKIIYRGSPVSGTLSLPVWSPGSQYLAVSGSTQTKILDALTGRTMLTIPLGGIPVWSPHSDLLAIGSSSGITIVNGQTGTPVSTYTYPVSWPPTGLAPTSGGALLVSRLPLGGVGGPGDFAWSPDGKWIAATYSTYANANGTSVNGAVQVWNTRTGKPAYTLATEPGAEVGKEEGAAWSSDGHYLAVTMVGILNNSSQLPLSQVKVWNMQTRHLAFHQSLQNGSFAGVGWQPGTDNLAATMNLQKTAVLKLWNVLTGHLLTSYSGSAPILGPLSWSPDGHSIVYGTNEESFTASLVVLNAMTGQHLYTYRAPDSWLLLYLAGNWSPNGKYIASLETGSKGMSTTSAIQIWTA